MCRYSARVSYQERRGDCVLRRAEAAEAADNYSFAAFCKEVVDFVASTGGNSTSE